MNQELQQKSPQQNFQLSNNIKNNGNKFNYNLNTNSNYNNSENYFGSGSNNIIDDKVDSDNEQQSKTKINEIYVFHKQEKQSSSLNQNMYQVSEGLLEEKINKYDKQNNNQQGLNSNQQLYSGDNLDDEYNISQDKKQMQYQDDEDDESYDQNHFDIGVVSKENLYTNHLISTEIPDLVNLKYLYNPYSILNKNNLNDNCNVLLGFIQSQSNLNMGQKERQTMKIPKKKKNFKNIISKVIIRNHNKVELIVINLEGEYPKVNNYYLSYDFGNITPSPFIVQEPNTGRFFMYDNNNKILCFSHIPQKNSERDDKSRPLIEMFLQDESIRCDPTLYIKCFEDFNILLVIGGYRKNKKKSKHEKQIQPTDSIKVFKLERKMVSTTYILELKLNHCRQNPLILKYKERTEAEDEYDDEQNNNNYLLFIGGNNIQEYKRMNQSITAQNLITANETCEVLECNILYSYAKRRQTVKEVVPIEQKTLRIKYNEQSDNDSIEIIRDCMFKGCIQCYKSSTNQEPRRFLFGDKKAQILEIKYINIKNKVISITDGEFGWSSNSTVYPSMARILKDKLYYITDSDKKVKMINLKKMREQGQFGGNENNINKTSLYGNTAQENRGGICQIF